MLDKDHKDKPFERVERKATGLTQRNLATDTVARLPGKDLIRTVESSTAYNSDLNERNVIVNRQEPKISTQQYSSQPNKPVETAI